MFLKGRVPIVNTALDQVVTLVVKTTLSIGYGLIHLYFTNFNFIIHLGMLFSWRFYPIGLL